MTHRLLPVAALLLAAGGTAYAQTVTLPPSGDNQRSEVTQQIGLVKVSIEYSSPDVHAPNGDDRRGKIWGGLVPYGIYDLGFNNRKGPWRAGANENTVLSVSHPVKIEGKPLPAGRYGVHMIASPTDWTLILSKTSTAWGSFTYEDAEDALRVTVKPEKAPYREWLTYDFSDRKPDRATAALAWEELRIPFTITVDDMPGLYIENLRHELRGNAGFNWQNWSTAAQVPPAGEQEPGRGAEVGGLQHQHAGRRTGELHYLLDEGADPGEALAHGRSGQGDDDSSCTTDDAGRRDSPIRPPAAGAKPRQGRDGGLPEERGSLQGRVACARRPRARLLGDGRLQERAHAR